MGCFKVRSGSIIIDTALPNDAAEMLKKVLLKGDEDSDLIQALQALGVVAVARVYESVRKYQCMFLPGLPEECEEQKVRNKLNEAVESRQEEQGLETPQGLEMPQQRTDIIVYFACEADVRLATCHVRWLWICSHVLIFLTGSVRVPRRLAANPRARRRTQHQLRAPRTARSARRFTRSPRGRA